MNTGLINLEKLSRSLKRNKFDSRSDTTTRSFRFDLALSRTLEKEAERMGISVNALVGIIIKRYVEFTRYLSKIDMIVINREFVTALIGSYEDDRLCEIGQKLGETVSKDTILFWKKELSEQTVLDYIEKIICRYGHLGTYDETLQSNGRTVVIRHRLGLKGSIFFEGYLKSTLKNTAMKDAIFEITESSIKFFIQNS